MKQKGQLSGAMGTVITLVLITITLGIGATVLSEVQGTQVTGAAGCNSTVTSGCGLDYNASLKGLESLETFSNFLPVIAIVVVAAIVIGLFAIFRMRG